MIQYHRSPFGLNLLLRFSGSAVYRGALLGVVSVIFLFLIRFLWTHQGDETDVSTERELRHPYAVGVLVTGTSFLLVFRLQAAYARYWEAASAVHQMMSKWMDAVVHTAAYHMQNRKFDHIKPPSFYEYHDLNALFLTRDRERTVPSTASSVKESTRVHDRAIKKSIETVSGDVPRQSVRGLWLSRAANGSVVRTNTHGAKMLDPDGQPLPFPLEGPPQLDGNYGALFPGHEATYFDPKNPSSRDPKGFASMQGGRTPSLFLQELSHLASLMTAVAMSTLRNDIEGAESPLDIYTAGAPWPEADPDKSSMHETSWMALKQKWWNFFGCARTPEERTKYNAARPLPVLGGVSDAEIRFLQMARGASAKTELSWFWLSEFIIREHLAGTLGEVGPPIISRIFQFLSDGKIFYNHARKIMYIPFPFPHAQLSVVFVIVTLPTIAFLMDQYCPELWVAAVLTFLSTTVMTGMNEVARELENPFRNVPNELPLVTLQAQFNEALIVMFAGYHPDHFWEDEAEAFLNLASPTTPSSTPEVVDEDMEEKKETPERAVHLEEKLARLVQQVEQQALELERLRERVREGETITSNGEDRKTR